jgi:hypothetical protein
MQYRSEMRVFLWREINSFRIHAVVLSGPERNIFVLCFHLSGTIYKKKTDVAMYIYSVHWDVRAVMYNKNLLSFFGGAESHPEGERRTEISSVCYVLRLNFVEIYFQITSISLLCPALIEPK